MMHSTRRQGITHWKSHSSNDSIRCKEFIPLLQQSHISFTKFQHINSGKALIHSTGYFASRQSQGSHYQHSQQAQRQVLVMKTIPFARLCKNFPPTTRASCSGDHFTLQPTPMRLSPVKVGFKHLHDASGSCVSNHLRSPAKQRCAFSSVCACALTV